MSCTAFWMEWEGEAAKFKNKIQLKIKYNLTNITFGKFSLLKLGPVWKQFETNQAVRYRRRKF